MRNYKVYKGRLTLIEEVPFKLERDLQKLTEDNLELVFGLELVRSEFTINNNFRIDTLAFDTSTRSFVIIEYKRHRNFSVIDQGYAYLSLMLNNKSDFILEYNENHKNNLKRTDVEWSQSRVMFVAPSFTTYQREAINFKDLPIELWEVRRYGNETVTYNQVRSAGSSESVKTITRDDKMIEKVNKEIRVYTEEEHLEGKSQELIELYEVFKASLLSLDGVELKPKKKYLAFVGKSNVVDIHIQQKALKIWINLPKGHLEDPRHLSTDVSTIGHWGNGDYQLQISSDEDLDYIMSLVKQSYRRNKY